MEQITSWKSFKIWFVFLISLVLLISLFSAVDLVNPEIHFPDPALEQVIRGKIERPTGPIYRADVQTITEIHAAGLGIRSLEGLGYLRRLAYIDLENNQIEDLVPLTNLRKLAELNLRHNQVSDLEPLSRYRRLQKLDLRDNLVSEILPLCTNRELVYLNLRDNLVEDLTPLACNISLVYLNLHSNPVKYGLSSLSSLVKLETLIMRNVFIGDRYSFLGKLVNLNRLNIRNTGITDVSEIGNLMAVGALQNDPSIGVTAVVDLLDISPTAYDSDPYHNLRRYWDNIEIRYPINLPYYSSSVQSPTFSHLSGFYEEGFDLSILTRDNNEKVYYTIDGSEPMLSPALQPMNTTKEYITPIEIQNKENQPNILANIETSQPDYFQYRPPSEVMKATIIRAIATNEEGLRSNVVTHTYFIGQVLQKRYTFPIVSITLNPNGLFDDRNGIYVPGDLFEDTYDHKPFNPANYRQRGMKWERPAYYQFFNNRGELLISQNIGVRVHGSGARWFPQKSLRIIARKEYDNNEFINFDFFPNLNNRLTNGNSHLFETIILRNSGQDWIQWDPTMFKDSLSQNLLVPTKLDIQDFQPVVVFLNGYYWGIHNIRTRYDEQYFENYYGIESKELVVLEDNNNLRIGSDKDIEDYIKLLEFIDSDYEENNFQTSSRLSYPGAFAFITDRIDIDNFIDYYVSQIYFRNDDWPGNNVIFWRRKVDVHSLQTETPYGDDGKWRWMIIDTDFGFKEPSHNTLFEAIRDDGDEWYNEPWSTFLIRSLLENSDFKTKFINRFADHLNTIFREEVVVERIDYFEKLYEPEIEEQIHRWGNLGGTHENWLSHVDELRNFALLRPQYQREHVVGYFDLSGTSSITVQTDPSKGYIKINTIEIREGQVGVNNPSYWIGTFFNDVPIEITAVPYDGYCFVTWISAENYLSETNLISFIVKLDEDIELSAEFSSDCSIYINSGQFSLSKQ